MRDGERDDRKPSEELLADSIDVGKRSTVFVAGQAVTANDAVDFRVRLLLNLGIECRSKEVGIDHGDGLRSHQ